ncbi:unnamed protein product [Rhizophagus irregularis]|nr:unnamed protein product [Rhizophagus irregularis]
MKKKEKGYTSTLNRDIAHHSGRSISILPGTHLRVSRLFELLGEEGKQICTANKFQSQKVRKDYEDLMTSRNKRFLDNTLTNNEEVSKKVSIEYSFECLHS